MADTLEIGTINIPRDTTLEALVTAQNVANSYLAAMAADSVASVTADFSAIQKMVKQGIAQNILPIGTQINVPWSDASGNEYTWPFDVVSYRDVELEDGETVPGMVLQAHFASVYTIQFDQSEALYYCSEDLPAGTYCFTIGTTWGSKGYCVADTSYYFTTTVDIPAGGQIRVGLASETSVWGAPDNDPANWRVYTYESINATEPLESALELTEGTEGTELGTTTSTIKYADSGINNLQRAAYGYNRWSQSAYRQYLNSAAAAGSWWNAQNNFDRAPAQLANYPGFMAGFSSDFLAVLGKVKVTTALNTVSDSEIGTSEDTYDTFFLPSLEELYITPQLSGVEGTYWEYWKQATGSTTTIKTGVTGAFPITYALNSQTSAQTVRLRSAHRGTAFYVWHVTSTGNVSTGNASGANRCAPACVVC